MNLKAAKVMKNYTVCIPKNIRKECNIHIRDIILFTYLDGKIVMEKAPSSWSDIAGIGKKVYQKYGGGEKYLIKERESWSNDSNV